MFNIKDLRRDGDYIRNLLKDSKEYILTTKDLYIVLPTKFIDRGLTSLGTTTITTGIFAIIDPDTNKYSLSAIPSKVTITPSEIDYITIDDKPYVAMLIEKNNPLIDFKLLIKDTSAAYEIFELFYIQANIPFFIEYYDLDKIFNNLLYYTGSKAGNNLLVYEILTSIIARDKSNLKNSFRLKANDETIKKKEYLFRGLKDINNVVSSVISKIIGSYFKQGLTSSMTLDNKEVTTLEHALRE